MALRTFEDHLLKSSDIQFEPHLHKEHEMLAGTHMNSSC